MRSLGQQQRKAVFHLTDLFFQVDNGILHFVISSFHLRDCRFISQTGIHQSLRRCHCLFPAGSGLPRNGQLFIQHQQGIIVIGDVGYQTGVDRLLIVLALGISGFRLPFGIAEFTEDVQLPTGRNRQSIGTGHLTLHCSQASLRSQCERREESQFGRKQSSLCLFDA